MPDAPRLRGLSLVPRPLGIAVDLENLREGVRGFLALLRELESENAVVHLVGGRWAQALAPTTASPVTGSSGGR